MKRLKKALFIALYHFYLINSTRIETFIILQLNKRFNSHLKYLLGVVQD